MRLFVSKKFWLTIGLLGLLVILGAGFWLYRDHEGYQAVSKSDTTVKTVTIEQKDSLTTINDKLRAAGLVKKGGYFTKYANKYGEKGIQSGDYRLSPIQDVANIYQELTQGPDSDPVLPAGYTYLSGTKTSDQTLKTLANAANVDPDKLQAAYKDQSLFQEAKKKYPQLMRQAQDGQSLYDFVYPGIYKFKQEKSANDFVLTLLDDANQQMKPYYQELDQNKIPASTAILLAEDGGKKEFDRRLAFIHKLAPYTKELKDRFGILPSISIAQAIHESNWDNSKLSSKYNNFYGVKTDDETPGKSVVLDTQEVENGQTVTKQARFAVYSSYKDSMKAHAKTLANGNSWNAHQFDDVLAAKDYQSAAQALVTDGYATDPNYAKLIIRIIENWNLAQYD
ncbi:endolytic transglycosylase MltG [Leuconostocaceae bacterium ESL0958]|nr:endolytic transglycosylase MltG [Leuconostocaceae bacterium ESL0958]